MSRFNSACTAFATLHLVLVALSAAQVKWPWTAWWSPALHTYAEMSGADNSYGFFAPIVPDEFRVRFELVSVGGRRWNENLIAAPPTQEVALRISTIVDKIRSKDAVYQTVIAASLASAVLGRNPTATEITLVAEHHTIPATRDWRLGQRGAWQHYYRASFRRDRASGSDGRGDAS